MHSALFLTDTTGILSTVYIFFKSANAIIRQCSMALNHISYFPTFSLHGVSLTACIWKHELFFLYNMYMISNLYIAILSISSLSVNNRHFHLSLEYSLSSQTILLAVDTIITEANYTYLAI